jgi:cysteine desulfurase
MQNKPNIFLDYNATTPILPEALAALNAAYSLPLNPSSVHHFGSEAKKLLQNSRIKISNAFDAEGAEIIFTASGTEANNLLLKGFKGTKNNPCSKLIISAIEHSSVLKVAEELNLEAGGAEIIRVDANGIIDFAHLEEILQKNSALNPLVSIMLANNETGVIQPISQIADLVFKYNGFLHSDATQAAGKIALSFNNLKADIITISSHKIGGAKGAACLIAKKNLNIQAQIIGGGQERGFRAGTEDLPAIASFAAAAEAMSQKIGQKITNNLQSQSTSIDFWQSRLIYNVKQEIKKIAPEAVIFGDAALHKLPNTICVATPKISSETQLINYDLAGISLSSGAACSSGRVNISHVLLAMNVPVELAKCAIRISFGWLNTEDDIKRFLQVFEKNYQIAKNR